MNRLQQIFNTTWAIAQTDFMNMISILHPSIQAGNFSEIEDSLAKTQTTIKAFNLGFVTDSWDFNDANLPNNSIAVIYLNGILYSWESSRIARYLEMAISNSKIAGVVLRVNGVGGMVNGVSEVLSVIEKSDKPIVSVITGNCMSAHYWIAAATHRRFLLDKTCQAGSVGVVGTYYNATEAMKKEGIDYREIYPNTADLKNREYRDIAEKNDEAAFKNHLQQIHALFCDSVSKHLSIPYSKELPLFRGASFMGDDAIKAGLADSYGDMNEAAKWILAQTVIGQTKDIV